MTPHAEEPRRLTQETSSRRRPRAAQIAAEAGAVALSAAIVAGMGAYATRRDLAQGMAEQWLRDQGIPGVLRVEQLDADGFSGSLLIGPEADPDLKVDRVEVDLALEPAWADERFKVSARAVRLVRPQLKAELGDGGLTFGRLDPVVRDFLARPPDEDAVGPVVLIEDGAVRLATDYGAVRLSGSGAIDDGRLVRFDGRTAPAQLRGEGLSADLGAGAVRLAGQGQRLTGRATLDVNAWSGGAVTVQDGALTLDVDAPYPEGEGADLEGPLVVEAALDAASLSAAGAQGPEGSREAELRRARRRRTHLADLRRSGDAACERRHFDRAGPRRPPARPGGGHPPLDARPHQGRGAADDRGRR
jgi:hypothetical protein